MIILIAEDDKALQRAYARILNKHTVHISSNGTEALKLLEEGLNPDRIISDYDMDGGLNGGDFIREVKRRGIPAPVMLVTGGVMNIPIEKLAAECGADRWAVKPSHTADVLAFVGGV